MKIHLKRLIAAIVTLALFALILLKVDRAALLHALAGTRPIPFAIAMALFIPQNFIIMYRWKGMVSQFVEIGWKETAGLILAAASMNIVLPSKMGDLSKAYFLKRSGALDLTRAVNLVLFEKLLDLGSLSLLAFLGLAAAWSAGMMRGEPMFLTLSLLTAAISLPVVLAVLLLYFLPERFMPWKLLSSAVPRASSFLHESHEVTRFLRTGRARPSRLAALSIALWLLHLLQIYFFFIALDAPVPVFAFLILMPLAIFAGLLPLSLFGMGTRDWAIIFLFSAWQPSAVLAGVGLFVNLRYIVPALTGLPFLQHYLALTRQDNQPIP